MNKTWPCSLRSGGAGRWQSLVFKPVSADGLLRVDEPLEIVDMLVCVSI